MDRIECTAVVDEEHQAFIQLPKNVAPGKHQIILLINESSDGEPNSSIEALPTISVGAWPNGLSLRREDMYDDG
jgi:hypothetical protein